MNIQVHGAIETNNFGDILLAVLFCRKIKDLGHTVIVKGACKEFYDYMNGDVVTDGKPDKVVFCGGGYLCDGNLRFSLHMIKTIFINMAKCRIKKIPYVIIGAGTKVFKCKITKPFISWSIKGAEKIYVRNEESKLDLDKIGVKKNVYVTADNVMVIDKNYIKEASIKKIKKLLSDMPQNNKNILIHLNYLNIDGNELITQKAKVLYNAMEKINEMYYDTNFIVCCDHKIDLFIEQCNKLENIFKKENSKIIISDNIDDMLALIYLSDGVITTKLHVGISAVALNKKVVSFPMHPKTKRFFYQIGEAERCKMLEDINNEDEIISIIQKSMNKEYDENLVNIIRNRAKSNYDYLEKFVGVDENGKF